MKDTKFEYEDEVNRIRGFIASVTKETPKDTPAGDGTNPPTPPGGPGKPPGGSGRPPGGGGPP